MVDPNGPEIRRRARMDPGRRWLPNRRGWIPVTR